MPQEITYYCSFCPRRETVTAPTTFFTEFEGVVEDAACPEHAPAMKFLADQCPGCVSGWGDCGMFTAIGNGKVSEDHLTSIRSGRCPFRINGTVAIGPQGAEQINLSKASRAGEAFAQAAVIYQNSQS